MTTLFILCAFFFPRITLIACFFLGTMPPNDTPLAADIIAAIIAPRLLVAWWLYSANAHPLLVGLFAVGGIMELLGGGSRARRRKD